MKHSVFVGEPVTRAEPCRICGSFDATRIGRTDFWDLQQSDIVECNSCKLIQLDPMISARNTAIGCEAYYLKEIFEIPLHEQQRNLLRNYRRGIVFGAFLQKSGFKPATILEFGPGSGYFCAGVQFAFPESRITVVDIVGDVLSLN